MFKCSCGRLKEMPAPLRNSSSIQQLLLVVVSTIAAASRAHLRRKLEDGVCPCCHHAEAHIPTKEELSQLQHCLSIPCYHQQVLEAVGVPKESDRYEVLGHSHMCGGHHLVSVVTFGLVYPGCEPVSEPDAGQPSRRQQQQQQQQQGQRRPWQQQEQQRAFLAHLLTTVEVSALRPIQPFHLRSMMGGLSLLLSAYSRLVQGKGRRGRMEHLLPVLLEYLLPAVRYAEGVLGSQELLERGMQQHELTLQLAQLLSQLTIAGAARLSSAQLRLSSAYSHILTHSLTLTRQCHCLRAPIWYRLYGIESTAGSIELPA